MICVPLVARSFSLCMETKGGVGPLVGVARYDDALLTAAESGVGKTKAGVGPLVGVARNDDALLTAAESGVVVRAGKLESTV